ncbi:MAG: hypothetical protein HDR71_09820, partial [Lachnospiraceae bacterium]|nr:hypothetical protein [Lachnospiraceae bacterium]
MKNVLKPKRWIALFLALLLIVTTCVSSTDAFLWASPEDEASKEVNMPTEKTKEISFDDEEEESSENESYDSIEIETGDENEGDSDDNDSIGTETDSENNGSDEGDGLDEGDEVTDPDETLPSEDTDETLGSDDETGDENVTYSYVIKYYFYNEDKTSYEEDTIEGTGKLGEAIPFEDSIVHNGLQYVFDHIEGSKTITETEDDNIVTVYYKLKTEETEEEEETEGNDQESELTESVTSFLEAMEELPEADEVGWEEAGTVYSQLISDEMSEGYREAREFLESQENQEDNEVKKACDKYEALLETTKNMRNIKVFVDAVEEVPAREDITSENAREVHDLLNRDEVSDGYRQALGVREKFKELWEFCDKYASVLDAASTILGYNESELHLDSNLSFEDLQDRINNANRPLTILPGDSSYTFPGTLTIPAGKTITIQGIAVSGTVNGPLIEVGGGGWLILSENASLNGNGNGSKGGGIYVGGGGKFELNGGTISGCGAGLGGGVFVDTNGTFDFTSGTIEGCSAKFGGGVYVNGGGHFNFNGGAIEGCSAEVGGGVYLELDAVFERSGGEIRNCTATVSDNDIYDAKNYTGDNKDKLVGQAVQIAIIRDASCIPNEPSVSTQKYLFLRDSYEGDYGYPVFAPNAAGYINRDILNDPNYKYADGAEGVSYSGKQYLKDIDWDKVLAAVANWNENEGQNEEWTVHGEDGEKLTKGNMGEYEIYPYVVKLEGSGWHIDCVVVPKNRVKLLYQLNLGTLVDNVRGFVAPAGNTYSSGTNVEVGSVKYYDRDVKIGDPINVTKDGKEATLYFAGWSTSIDGTASIYKPGDNIQINGDTTLYGVWRTEYITHDISYTVEYYKNDVKADEEIIKDSVLSDVNSLRVKPIDENKYEDENFEFDHYEVDERMELPETVEDGTVIKVYYVSKEATYIVKHLYQNIEDDGYTENEDHRETLSGAIGAQTAAQARSEAGFIAQEVVQKTIQADVLTVVEIYYDRQSYEVSYSYSGEVPDGVQDAPEKATKAYNTLVNVDTTYQAGDTVEDARGEWTFSGWSTEDATVEEDGSFEMPANNVAFTGNWTLTTAAEYEVSYSYGEDVPTTAISAPAAEKKEYNATVNVNTTYKAGSIVTDARGEWTFSGWSTTDATVKNGSFDMPAKDVAFTGSWELTTAAEYEVSYSYGGAAPDTVKSAPGTEKKNYNTLVDVDTTYKVGDKETDTRGEWTFKGWSTGDAAVENGSFKMPAKNVAFTGSWELTGRKSYDILYTYVGDVPTTAA